MKLHLPALRDDNISRRPVQNRPRILNFPNDIHPVDNLPKNNVLVIQMRRFVSCYNEELAAVCIRAGVLHVISSVYLGCSGL